MYEPNVSRQPRLPVGIVFFMVAFGIAFGFGGGYILANVQDPPAQCTDTREVCADFVVFWEAWSLARQRYVDVEAIDPERMTEGAIEGMLATLGDEGHTRFLSAEDAQRWEEALDGSFEGIGAYFDVRDEEIVIIAPLDGSPAQRAGIRPGDIILAINGESTEGMAVEEVGSRIRGPGGTSVTLLIQHAGEAEPVEITVERARIEVPAVTWRMLEGEIAIVRLSGFTSNSADEMEQALREVQQAGANGIILDLRNNGGGLLNQLLAIASEFLEPGTTVLLERDRRGNEEPETTTGDGVARDIPLVVLVNENSASSAEILAGALRDAGRAKLVGVATFGTGTVLNSFGLEGGAQLLLGTREWLTPNGDSIRGEGVQPDEVVELAADVIPVGPVEAEELSAEELLTGADTQLGRAYELLTGR
jgi:carboxyl-terminal processing protease